MTSYGSFFPVARAAEIVAQRWTPRVLRELMVGNRRFNDIRRGVPLMSPALLARRLRALVEVCSADPGHPADVTLCSDVRIMAHVLLGDVDLDAAIRADTVRVDPDGLRREVPRWLEGEPATPVDAAGTEPTHQEDRLPRNSLAPQLP